MHATGYRILRSSNPRTLKNDPTRKETRRGHNKITPELIREMEKILENEGLDGRSLTWMQLGFEAQIEASEATIQRAMGTLKYHKGLAYQRGWQSHISKKNQVQYAELMLARYPNSKDLDRIRFSDEVHFGWGPQHQLCIICKPGECYCVDCIQHSDGPKPKDEKRFHCWAAVGYDFKSDITFYEVPGNTNGKMSLQVNIDQILELGVNPWLLEKEAFMFEEDGDSGHGKAKICNFVRQWKEENNLEYFSNCASSPDLSFNENCWQLPKQHLKKFPHWDDRTTKELIVEGWDLVLQSFLNEKCQSMPKGLRDVVASESKIVGY